MQVRAVVSFSGFVNNEMHPWQVGQVGELPEGVDWLRLGWVTPVEPQPAAAAVEEPAAPAELQAAVKDEPAPAAVDVVQEDAPAPARKRRGSKAQAG